MNCRTVNYRTVNCVCGHLREYQWVFTGYINFPRFTDGSRECPNCHKYYHPGDLIDLQASKSLFGWMGDINGPGCDAGDI